MKREFIQAASGVTTILLSLPIFGAGILWTLGGSRPHLAPMVVPLGISTLVIAIFVATVGVWRLLAK